MKRVFKLTGFLAGLAAALWLMRDRLISLAIPREPQLPTFRTGPVSEPDDLTAINGIGAVFASRLRAAGITSFAGLVEADAELLSEKIGTQRARVEGWIAQAVQRVGTV